MTTTIDITRTSIEVTHVPAQTDAGNALARPFADVPERRQHEQLWADAMAAAGAVLHLPGNRRWLRVLADDRLVAAGQTAALLTAHRELADLQRKLFGRRAVRIEPLVGGGS